MHNDSFCTPASLVEPVEVPQLDGLPPDVVPVPEALLDPGVSAVDLTPEFVGQGENVVTLITKIKVNHG